MEFIDRNITHENIKDKLALLKQLVRDLESDMNEQNNIKTQMDIYKSIIPIRLRINNYENKIDRWTPPTAPIIWDHISSRLPAFWGNSQARLMFACLKAYCSRVALVIECISSNENHRIFHCMNRWLFFVSCFSPFWAPEPKAYFCRFCEIFLKCILAVFRPLRDQPYLRDETTND